MKHLIVDVNFLCSRYHGAEWPPAPMRLLQAIVAGCHSTNDNALRWLESQNPPMIFAQADRSSRPITAFVPANNRKDLEAKVAKKIIERHVQLPVSYIYLVNCESDEQHAAALGALAQKVHTLGTGLDAAHVSWKIETGSVSVGHGHFRWVPWMRHLAPANATPLRTPVKGSLESIEMVYQFRLERNLYGKGEVPRFPNAPPNRYSVTPYAFGEASETSVALPISFYADSLLKKRWAAFAEDAVVIAGMLRHALLRRAEEVGVTEALKDIIAGHPQKISDPRVSYLPLPSIGHKSIDGHIRRALLLAPAQSEELADEWMKLLITLTPVEGSGKLGSWGGQNIPRTCASFADGFQHPRPARNIWCSAGGPTALCARSAPAGRLGSTGGGMSLNVRSADDRRLPRPARLCTALIFRFRNGFGRHTLWRHTRLESVPCNSSGNLEYAAIRMHGTFCTVFARGWFTMAGLASRDWSKPTKHSSADR